MTRCAKCSSLQVVEINGNGKCRDCGHSWGLMLEISKDVNKAFANLFGDNWS